MTADRIASAFVQAASHLGFEFQAGFSITLDDGSVVRSLGRLPRFGSRRGALVFADDSRPSAASLRALDEMGYFTSVLFPSYETFDARHFSETLDDWGYYGHESDRPAWYTGLSWGAGAAQSGIV
jgi:hypothetical protein